MERNITLDFVRCLANYTIILLHAGAAYQYCNPESFEYKFWICICWDICVAALPALFLISGYLLFRNFQMSSYPKKIERRVRRLVVPYIIWNCTFVAFYLALGHFVPRLSARVSSFGLDSFNGAFEKIISLTVAPIDGPLWFLRTLFLLSLFSPILWLLVRSKIGRFIGFILILIAYYVCYVYDLLPSMRVTYPLFAIVTFYLGGIIAVTKDLHGSFEWFKSKLWLLVCIAGFILLLFYLSKMNEISSQNALIGDLGRLLLTPLLFFIANQVNIEKISTNKIYIFLKDMSFFAYTGHFLFCSMIMHTVASFLGFMTIGKFTLLIFVFCAIGVPFMACIYMICKKFIPSVLKLYDGTL